MMKIRTRRNPSPNESLSMCSFIPEGCAGVCGQVSVVIFSSIPNLVGCLFTHVIAKNVIELIKRKCGSFSTKQRLRINLHL